jgi:hypothetical protein
MNLYLAHVKGVGNDEGVGNVNLEVLESIGKDLEVPEDPHAKEQSQEDQPHLCAFFTLAALTKADNIVAETSDP